MQCTKNREMDWLLIDNQRRIQLTPYATEYLAVDSLKFIFVDFAFFRYVVIAELECYWQFFERKSDNMLKKFEKERFKIGDKVERGDYFEVFCKDMKRSWYSLL